MKTVVLIVLDGWGLAPPGPGNAISLANLKNIPHFWQSFPHGELAASGEAVGLPSGEDGNTETGHINLGAGRVVYQDLPRINMSIADGSFFKNDAFIAAMRYAQTHESNLHIMGLISDAGVHANREHLYALLEMARQQQLSRPVYLHLFTDGRDSPPQAGLRFVSEVEEKIASLGVGKIATIIGRYYAMDRDRRWGRTERAYEALTEGIGEVSSSAVEAIKASYAAGITDEFIKPTVITGEGGAKLPRIANHDAVIFYNYRIDRPRQLTRAFTLPNFESYTQQMSFDPYAVKYYHRHIVTPDESIAPFKRRVVLPDLFFVTMTEYERNLPCTVAYPNISVRVPLGEVFGDLNLRQLRLAETEKERFVTYYFNGIRDTPFAGEDRIIVPSQKVATYDLAPEMSAREITKKLVDRVALDVYSLILVNFANADMVGHTGNIPAAIKACEIIDECVGEIVTACFSNNACCMITADHGNVEEMLGPNGEVDTEHSTFPVPFMMIAKEYRGYPQTLPYGKLADVATTILAYLKIPVPGVMSGKNLLADLNISP